MKKKIIGIFMAFCVSAGALVQASGTDIKYSDVGEQIQYYDSIYRLSSLEIVEGHEDGSFKPESNITRAEASKIMVSILGSDYAQAASDKTDESLFDDVLADHWAAGYIEQGLKLGFIDGLGNNRFEPEMNVTYAQMVKMLVEILGYEAESTENSAWYEGYINKANSIGVTKNVVLEPDSEITRAEAAGLIDNALSVPVCALVGYEMIEETDENGETIKVVAPVKEIFDGLGDSGKFETLLTTYHDVYEVSGKMQKNELLITYSDNLDGEKITEENAVKISSDLKIASGNKIDALIKKDDSDNWYILYAKQN